MTVTKRGTVAVLIVSFVALVGAGLAHVGLRMKVVRLGYEISDLSRERRVLDEEHRRLQLERAVLRDPSRIERLAREKLGMRHPDPSQLRVARPGTLTVAAAVEPRRSAAGGSSGPPVVPGEVAGAPVVGVP